MAKKSPVVKTFSKPAIPMKPAAAGAPAAAAPSAPKKPASTPATKKAAPPANTATPKKAAGKKVRFFDGVGTLHAVRWMHKNGIEFDGMLKACKKFGVTIADSCAKIMFGENATAKKYDGLKLTNEQAAQLKAAAK